MSIREAVKMAVEVEIRVGNTKKTKRMGVLRIPMLSRKNSIINKKTAKWA